MRKNDLFFKFFYGFFLTVSLFDNNLLFLNYVDKYSCPSYEKLQLVFKNCSYTSCKSQFKNGKECRKTTFFHNSISFSLTVSLFDINLLFLQYVDRYSYPSYEILQLVFKNHSYTPCKSQFKNVKKMSKNDLFSHLFKVFPFLFHYLISICYF